MKIGLIQLDIQAQCDENLDTIERIFKISDAGHNIICLPELFHTNYSGLPDGAIDDSSPVMDTIRSLSMTYPQTVIVGSVAFMESSTLCNVLLLVHQGRVYRVYKKLHLFRPMREDKLFHAGSNLAILNLHGSTGIWRIGFALCYDLRFPEIFRVLADLDCHLVLVPAQWPARRIEKWRFLLKARAAENQFFVIGVNRVGRDGNEKFGGRSALVDPGGNTLVEGGHGQEFLTAELDMTLFKKSRKFDHSLIHRRSDLYQTVWSGGIKTVNLP